MYVEHPDGSLGFRYVKEPTGAELARLTQILAKRIGRYLERRGLLERDAENSDLAGDAFEAGPMERLNGEIKRRTDVVGIFPNEAAITRLVGAILLEQNDEWAVQRAPYMTRETMTEMLEPPAIHLPAVAG